MRGDGAEVVANGVLQLLTKLAEETGKVLGGEWDVEEGGARATRSNNICDDLFASLYVCMFVCVLVLFGSLFVLCLEGKQRRLHIVPSPLSWPRFIS